MLRNINKTIEAENAEFKIAQSKNYIKSYISPLLEEVVNTSVKRETASSSLGQHDHHGSDDESES
jgi:hypothetical protein